MFDLVHKIQAHRPGFPRADRAHLHDLGHRVLHHACARRPRHRGDGQRHGDLGARVRRGAAPPAGPAAPDVRRATSTTPQFDTPEMRARRCSTRSSRSAWSPRRRCSANLTVTRRGAARGDRLDPGVQGPDGSFSKSAYESMLRPQNPPMSPAQFESRLRYDLSLQQLTRAVGESAIPSRTVAERLAAIEAQKREVSEARIAAQQFLPQVKIDEAKVKAYYDANPAEFRVPERVRAEYVVLSAEQMAAQEPVSDADRRPARAPWRKRESEPKLREPHPGEDARRRRRRSPGRAEESRRASPTWRRSSRRTRARRRRAATSAGSAAGMMVKPFEDAAVRHEAGRDLRAGARASSASTSSASPACSEGRPRSAAPPILIRRRRASPSRRCAPRSRPS